METALDRVLTLIKNEGARREWLPTLQQDSAVDVFSVTCEYKSEIYVDGLNADGFSLSDGLIYTLDGVCHKNMHKTFIICEPTPESHAEYVKRKFANRLASFRWHALSVDQLDAVIKYAEAKMATAELSAVERRAA